MSEVASDTCLFRAYLLGSFTLRYRTVAQAPESVVYEEVSPEQWGKRRQAMRLLKVLLARPGRRASKDFLLELFWPDTEPEQAGVYLIQNVAKLRKVLRLVEGGESLLIAEHTGYRLASQEQLWVDADAAEALMQQNSAQDAQALSLVQQAVTLLQRGTLLEEEEGTWVLGRRGRLSDLRKKSQIRLAQMLAQQGRLDEAESTLSTLLEEDPIDEDVLSPLMELLHRQGMTHQALRYYKEFIEVAEKEGLEPTEEVRLLAERLRSEKRSVSHLKPRSIDWGGSAEHPSSTPRKESMLQLVQEQQASEQNLVASVSSIQGSFVSSESGFLVPGSLCFGFASSMDSALWFVLKQRQWEATVSRYYGQVQLCGELQALLNQEFDLVKPQPHDNDYTISRRQAIGAIAALPFSLLAAMQSGKAGMMAEEFLSQCTASLAACRHLYDGGDFGIVEYVLPTYEPILVELLQQSSLYRPVAAGLLSRLYRLLSSIAWHRNQKAGEQAYIQLSVQYSRLAKDSNLYVDALRRLADTYHTNPIHANRTLQPMKMLHTLQEATPEIEQVSPLLRSAVHMMSAIAQAQRGEEQEALNALELADENTPDLFTTDASMLQEFRASLVMMFKGIAYLELGEHNPDYYQHAENTFTQFEVLPVTVTVSEGTRFELVNRRAFTAMRMKNLELFEDYLRAGIKGAQTLSSKKLRQETIALYRKASREVWPHEPRVKELADLFVQ